MVQNIKASFSYTKVRRESTESHRDCDDLKSLLLSLSPRPHFFLLSFYFYLLSLLVRIHINSNLKRRGSLFFFEPVNCLNNKLFGFCRRFFSFNF